MLPKCISIRCRLFKEDRNISKDIHGKHIMAFIHDTGLSRSSRLFNRYLSMRKKCRTGIVLLVYRYQVIFKIIQSSCSNVTISGHAVFAADPCIMCTYAEIRRQWRNILDVFNYIKNLVFKFIYKLDGCSSFKKYLTMMRLFLLQYGVLYILRMDAYICCGWNKPLSGCQRG